MTPIPTRDRLAAAVTAAPFTITVITVASVTMALFGPVGFLGGLAVALFVLWATRWDWGRFGLAARDRRGRLLPSLLQALAWAALGLLLVDLLLVPWVERLTGAAHDYSGFAFIEGNLRNLVLFSLFMWVVAACGEEFFYRGYLMRQLATMLGDGTRAWVIAALLSAIPFGLVHLYQGVSGVITTGAMGLVLGAAFLVNRRNLLVCVLAHGLYDMVGLTLIYLGRADLLSTLLFG